MPGLYKGKGNVMNDIKVPQRLNAPYQILWFEEDDISIGSIAIALMVIDGSLLSFLASVAICFTYWHFKKRYPRSFLKHMLYYAGLMTLKGYPTTFQKEFHE